jgi:hypothetical protein
MHNVTILNLKIRKVPQKLAAGHDILAAEELVLQVSWPIQSQRDLVGNLPEKVHSGSSVSASVQADSKSANGSEKEKLGRSAGRRLPMRWQRRIHCANVSATSGVRLRLLDSAARQARSQ